MSTTNHQKLKKLIKTKSIIIRAIPMPPIRLGKGPVAIFPPNKKVKSFFDKIGTTIEIKNEKLSKNFWTISGTMASFYELLNVLSIWLIKKKTNKLDAQKYVTSLYSALAELALLNSSKPLENLVNEQTPGGLNWQGVNELKKLGYYRLLEKFKAKTNCPVLVNTSFNVRGEPIVNTPQDAFNCFMGTNLDLLVIGNCLLLKSNQNKELAINYKDKYELD